MTVDVTKLPKWAQEIVRALRESLAREERSNSRLQVKLEVEQDKVEALFQVLRLIVARPDQAKGLAHNALVKHLYGE